MLHPEMDSKDFQNSMSTEQIPDKINSELVCSDLFYGKEGFNSERFLKGVSFEI